MSRSLMFRGLLILGVTTLMGLAAYPIDEKINLGLDLQGGMYLALEVQTPDALEAETEKDMQFLIGELGKKGVSGVSGTRPDDSPTRFTLAGVSASDRSTLDEILDDEGLKQTWNVSQQGDSAVLTMSDQHERFLRVGAVRQAVETIRNRIDEFGVSEPVIQAQIDRERIIAQLPGVDDPERVKKLIQNTALLEFRYVDYPGPQDPRVDSEAELLAHYNGNLPAELEILHQPIRDEATKQIIGNRYYAVERRQVISGADLKTASTGTDQFNQIAVNFSLTPQGAQRFGESTAANVGRALGIILDGRVVSAPRIKEKISDRGMIDGDFTRQEVEDLVTTLKSGSLPASIIQLHDRTVGPSLGQDSIDQGRRAFLIGAALVALLILLVYKLSGLNALVALSLNVVIVFGALAELGATLTLPGIAGLILTVGMAVDANVLVFERIKEELRTGRTVKSAIDAGFRKALSSILDANATTLLAALFLFEFGTGPIRGFAVTLSIGILASVFTALFVSRWLFDLQLARRTRVEKLSI